ncbi:hypothetical protein N431DRAFT_564836 [Stipitochalara longipes BDJ]|nr:hypothetical protein N431DRAFT_564836 [Stipitochalara longipes BDJ]
MDPITAVGFAASILNFVDFSWTLIKGSYEIYDLGTTYDNMRITSVLSDLDGITKSLQSNVRGNSPHVKDLKSLAAECITVSQELSAILKDLEMKEGNKIWRSLEAKWKSMRKEKEIATIEQKLIEYRLQLLLRLNLMLSEQQTSVKSQLDNIQEAGLQLSIDSLDKLTTVHQAIQSLEQKLTGELFQSLKLNDSEKMVNASSLFEIHTSLISLMAQLKAVSNSSTAETRILKKLYFNSIHSRSETISDAEVGTFSWLLEDDTREVGLSDSESSIPMSSRPSNSRTDEKQSSELSAHESPEIEWGRIEEDDTEKVEIGSPPFHADRQIQAPRYQDSEDDDEEGGEKTSNGNLSGRSEEGEEGSDSSSLSGASEEGNDLSIEEVTLNAPESLVRYPYEVELHQRTRHSFLKWLNSGSGVYHISGKAGSGKSTLMKSLTRHPRLMEELRKWAGDEKVVFGKFFFWNSGDVQQRSLEGLYRSLLFEILNQCPDLIKEVFPSHWNNVQSQIPGWEDMPFLFSELREAMSIIVHRHRFFNHRFCFFIDGLDEFEGESTDHWELAQMLDKWASCNDVKICVSSRPYTEFLEVFDSSLRMQLHDLTRGDIERFTRTKFETEPYFDGADKRFSEIVDDIVRGADGVFLWVRLVVRSLLDGVRHRYSLPALRAKLHLIPRGLDLLFDKLFNDIDPADRGRSDRMLMLAASYGAVNALLYSWLEDLESPEFPHNAPIKALTDTEIRDRHTSVRAQLDSLSKGLLEMKVSEWSHKRDAGRTSASNDIYFQYDVDFFHRSVRDYLTEPVRYASIKGRLGDFDNTQAYRRLCLAEFKFARTMNDYFVKQSLSSSALVRCFEKIFGNLALGEEISPRLLDECGKVLEHHRQTPFSHPDETLQNPGVISWGQIWDSRGSHGIISDNGISYPHWLALNGQRNYLITHFLSTKISTTPIYERSLLLTASISLPHYKLVCDLLIHRASPNDQITVTSIGNLEEKRVTTVWAVFLTIMIQNIRFMLGSPWHMNPHKIRGYFLILEEFLKSGVDNDVCFLFRMDRDKTKNDEDVMILVTLEDFILSMQPTNSDTLMKLAMKGKGSLLWNGTMQLLSTLRPWIGGVDGAEPKYREAQLGDLFAETDDPCAPGVFKSVCIRGDWLENDFVVGWL